jgi:hypothetical protein
VSGIIVNIFNIEGDSESGCRLKRMLGLWFVYFQQV